MARRRDAVPEPGAYWLYCPACAACTRCITISGGVSKSGLPCPRFRALYCCASLFISVKTVVPNVATRRAEVDIYNYSPLDYSCGKFRTSYLLVVDNCGYYTCLLDFRQLCSDSISRSNQAPPSVCRTAPGNDILLWRLLWYLFPKGDEADEESSSGALCAPRHSY